MLAQTDNTSDWARRPKPHCSVVPAHRAALVRLIRPAMLAIVGSLVGASSAHAFDLIALNVSTDPRFMPATLFHFFNASASPVGYTATCYAEQNSSITYGTARTGTLSPRSLNAIRAADVCIFSGVFRGAVRFTINAPPDAVKGQYQMIASLSADVSYVPMTRAYSATKTSE